MWSESELATIQAGTTTVQVCPKCRLGVSKVVVERSFWTKVPGAFSYPLRGSGAFVVVMGTPLLLANDFLGFGLLFIILKLILLGLIGTLLHQWPEPRSEAEKPVIYRREVLA